MTTAFSLTERARAIARVWKPMYIGIAIDTDRVSAIELSRHGSVRRFDGPGATSSAEVGAAVRAALLAFPPRALLASTPTVVVVLAPALAQCKRIFGLPAVRDRRLATALVRESSARFFRRTSESMVTSDAELGADAEVHAAAAPAETIRELRLAAEAARVRLKAVIPRDAFTDQIASLQGSADAEGDAPMAAALVAARVARAQSASRFNLLDAAGSSRRASRLEVQRALSALGVAIVAAIVAPVLLATWQRSTQRDAHAVLRSREEAAVAVARELATASERLLAIAQHAASRRSSLALLGQLTRALPSGAAITEVRLDSIGGTVTALTPSADVFLRGLTASPLVSAPTIVGAVTRERQGDRDLERVSIRFRHAGYTLPSSSTPARR